MALTQEDAQALNALFPQSDHEFTRGFVYIQERAICDRLDAVDPSWCFDIKSVQVRDSDVVVVATLSLLGCVREGVGMAKIVEKGAEAEKSAATDALKRAARLFGVGRYLLGAPDEKQFAGWLAKLARADTPIERPANGWTREQANNLITYAQAKGIDTEELLRALDVSRISEYSGGYHAAQAQLKKYAAARPKTPTAPATDLFAGDAD